MKQFAVAVLFVMSLALIGCGSNNSSNSNNVNGNWNASLVSGGNSPVFAFGTTMTANSNGSLVFTNFHFHHQLRQCCALRQAKPKPVRHPERGFQWQCERQIWHECAIRNTLRQCIGSRGSREREHDTGKWTLTGSSSCTGSGTFTMTKV